MPVFPRRLPTLLTFLSLLTLTPDPARAADLVIADGGKTQAVVVVSPKAGAWEKRAADDLVHYIGLMSGAKPTVARTDQAIAAALKASTPVLIVGTAALNADPSLRQALAKVAKKDPVL